MPGTSDQQSILNTGALWLGFVAVIGVFLADLMFPLGIAGGTLYVVPVLLGLWVPGRRYTVFMTALGIGLTIVGYFVSPEFGPEAGVRGWHIITNRVLSILGIGAAGYFVLRNKNVEKRLLEEEQQKTYHRQMAEAVFIGLDLRGRVISLNRKGEQILGYSEAELLGRDWFETCLLPQDRSRVKEVFDRLVGGEIEPVEFYENPVVTKSGETRIIAWHNTVVRDEGGKIASTFSSGRDVTDQARAEQALRESERTLETLWANLPGMAYRCRNDDRRTLLLVSEGARSLTGYEPAEFIGDQRLSYVDLIHPGDRKRSDETVLAALRAQVPFTITYRLRTADGGEKWVWEQGRGIYSDADGGVRFIEGFVTDITELKEAEEGRRKAAEELEDFKYALDQSAIVAMTDARGRITYTNDKFCEISKYTREELLGEDHRIINSGHHPKEFMRELWQTIQTGRVWRGEICNRAKDGSIYWVDTTIVPFVDEKRTPFQYVAIRSDITARKEAQKKLREQETLARLGEMAAVVAHEVKNPLAGIAGAVQIIGGRLPPQASERKVVDDILQRIESLNRTIQDLLLYARPREPKMRPVDVVALLRDTATLLARDASYRELSVAVEGEAFTCTLDPELFQEVFLNLLLNAAQAMGGRGSVRVAAERDGGECLVTFTDEGPGIPPELREKVFQPFFSTKSRGTGLGLATAKRIVEAHGGAIFMDCPQQGGTVVRIHLHASPNH